MAPHTCAPCSWGIGGVCPGPALVNAIGEPSLQALAFVGAMAGGMLLHKPLVPLYQRVPTKQVAACCAATTR